MPSRKKLGSDGVQHRDVAHCTKIRVHVEVANRLGIVDVGAVNQWKLRHKGSGVGRVIVDISLRCSSTTSQLR